MRPLSFPVIPRPRASTELLGWVQTRSCHVVPVSLLSAIIACRLVYGPSSVDTLQLRTIACSSQDQVYRYPRRTRVTRYTNEEHLCTSSSGEDDDGCTYRQLPSECASPTRCTSLSAFLLPVCWNDIWKPDQHRRISIPSRVKQSNMASAGLCHPHFLGNTKHIRQWHGRFHADSGR